MTAAARRWSALVLCALLAVPWPAESAEPGPRASAGAAPIVILLSWDGTRYDYPDRDGLPALARMAREGVRAGRLTAVFPSDTFPGHVSLATGTYPDRHGIVDNQFIDARRGRYDMSNDADWIEAEPLWIAAERQGIPAATYFWVGSETDWHGQGTRYRVAPFEGGRPESQKVDQILAWMALPEAQRPRLIMSYWAGEDHVGHDHGPDSDAVNRQLQDQDHELGRLQAGIDSLGLWPRTTLIVVSDHGMAEMARYLDLEGVLADAGIAARITGSAVANVYLDDPGQAPAALAAVQQLEPVEVYLRAELPPALRLAHPTRSGDLVVITEPPYAFSRPPGAAGYLRGWLYALGWSFGGHGYDPRLREMGGVFLAMGRGVPAGLVLAEVHQVDVAPTVARLLGMEPPQQSEGRAVRGLGEQLVGSGTPR